jgi:hypothetical protein
LANDKWKNARAPATAALHRMANGCGQASD